MTKLIVMKKAGEPGEVAVNPDRITLVRATTPAFTDIFFGAERVAVEGSFNQVVAKLNSELTGNEGPPKDWLKRT